jgi:hypothetical protein
MEGEVGAVWMVGEELGPDAAAIAVFVLMAGTVWVGAGLERRLLGVTVGLVERAQAVINSPKVIAPKPSAVRLKNSLRLIVLIRISKW